MLLETVEDLLLDQLRDLYSTETQIEVALPLAVEQVTAPAVKDTLTTEFESTERQIGRLQEIFGLLGVSARGPRCLGIAGLLQENEDALRRADRGPLLDAVALSGMRRVAHYQIASYALAVDFARQVGQERIAILASQSLDEEIASEAALAEVALREALGPATQSALAS
jgi:ferritin-like metal-binding protein YciE